ncbi:hypothetical protein M431DRAFT_479776 [Trichoderma harzianum CBS 226.95]|uniref:AAA+ ATPase domain-containing protein n=1 Tax=Trichoderma harzianum CBS 226.95 TaxID=983964 RepID=A0A2T4AMH6_TRIHA|nr:hypothetical protein M431DRAFT_479776 [Trichoderma harzianum CBS 226.95]PTB58279.1 hypothetical protein M431DRAFT_479776 [Trichoderma harzianum CBS 226.95]
MSLNGPLSEADESKTVDTTSTMTSTLLASSQDETHSGNAGFGEVGDVIGDDNKPAAQGVARFVDDIETLKKKILELEQHAKAASSTNLEQENPPSEREIEREQYKRMEDCLYKHRKEWEVNVGPGGWNLWSFNDYFRNGRSDRRWELSNDEVYQRPNPFNPSHSCVDLKDTVDADAKADAYEEFDREIDYGHRRERLRKNFEWEMDRLYLIEESEKRKKHKVPRDDELEEPGKAEPDKDTERVFAKPKLTRVSWAAFKAMESMIEEESCAIDILIGDPIVDDDARDYRRWYGFGKGRKRKTELVLDGKTHETNENRQGALPERIRIHSTILRHILAKILSSNANEVLTNSNYRSIVFVRPFKALFFCKPALLDWYAELSQKLNEEKNKPSVSEIRDTEGDSSLTPAAEDSQVEKSPAEEPTAEKPVEQTEDKTDHDVKEEVTAKKEKVEKEGAEGKSADEERTEEEKTEEEKTEEEKKEEGKTEEKKAEDEEDEDGKLDNFTKSPAALEHISCLIDFIDSDVSSRVLHLGEPECRKVFFSDLWLLFRPGMEVIGSDGKQVYRVIGVTSAKHRVAAPWERWYNNITDDKRKASPFSITCIYIDFDGKNIGPVTKIFDFKRFDGEKDITLLEVYPLRFHPVKQSDLDDSLWSEDEGLSQHQKHRRMLIRRGAMFLEVAAVKHMYYAGPTLEVRDDVEGQVVIDFETAFSVEDEVQKQWKPILHPLIGNPPADDDDDTADARCRGRCCEGDVVYDDTHIDDQQKTEYLNSLLPRITALNEQPSIAVFPRSLKELRAAGSENGPYVTDEELVIMSYRVFGFVLRNRKWAKLDLTYMTAIHAPEASAVLADERARNSTDNKKPKTAFDRLVIEKEHRSMIVSLVAQHFRDKKSSSGQQQQFDIVKGKAFTGKGLILLLHGAPGVGKTSTAEGIAELFKKPLFQITCGDLGTTAAEVEKALETNFALANRWDCILLLDEADVFLAARTKEDFVRNGLVAVFLRVMEYYAGILFLTTNRVGDFDEAFTSRIHISLYYPELDAGKTLEVFDNNLAMIEDRFAKKNRLINIENTKIRGFAATHFLQHKEARWNGRQIRNACQTALALAEYEAQGNSHEAILKPDALVNLNERHFEIVQNAYLEFADYMNKLYGIGAAQRAKEGRLRAVWIDENNNIVDTSGANNRGQDKKKAFLNSTQAQLPQQQIFAQNSSPQPHQYILQQPQYSQNFQQHQDLQQQQQQQQQLFQQFGVPQQQYQHQNIVSPQPVYPNSNQMQMQMQMPNVPINQLQWNNRVDPTSSAPFQSPTLVQDPMQIPRSIAQQPPLSLSPPAVQQPQQQSIAQQLGQGIQSMYTASST